MDARRGIPSVDALLESPPFRQILASTSRERAASVLRRTQEEVRARLSADDPEAGSVARETEALSDPGWWAGEVAGRLAAEEVRSLRRVINATGVVLHTNLGRAPLAESARRAVLEVAGYASLEQDLSSGERGSRHDHCVALLRELTGAEAAMVVNNNAAAVVLALGALAAGGEAIVSRGELVEIGGSFRVPEIMERSGARLREVGATNRTHLRDYAEAIGPDTRTLLKVHRSNFRMEGYTSEVATAELAGVAREAGVPLVNDLGSGLLLDLSEYGLPGEPTAGEVLAAGADVVTLSGDKLLGGPQAGIVLGRTDLVDRMRSDPLARALRPDKLTLAALEATLALYREPDRALREVPVLRMLVATREALADRAQALVRALDAAGVRAEEVEALSAVGGGAYPGVELPTVAVAIPPRDDADDLTRRLRLSDPAVVARIQDGRILLDPRTVDPAEEADLVRAVADAVGVS